VLKVLLNPNQSLISTCCFIDLIVVHYCETIAVMLTLMIVGLQPVLRRLTSCMLRSWLLSSAWPSSRGGLRRTEAAVPPPSKSWRTVCSWLRLPSLNVTRLVYSSNTFAYAVSVRLRLRHTRTKRQTDRLCVFAFLPSTITIHHCCLDTCGSCNH